MQEIRKFVRLHETWLIRYRILDTTKGREKSRTVDISCGGVRFYTNAILGPGTNLELELSIPSDSLLLFSTGKLIWQGKVVWCRESDNKDRWPLEVGVEFTNLNAYDRERVCTYIENHLKKQGQVREV